MSEAVSVSFDATDEDAEALRTLTLRRMRVPILEYCVHLMGAGAAILVGVVALAFRRVDLLPRLFAGVVAIWAAGWFYVAFVFSRPSAKSKAWHAKLRAAPVMTKGPTVVGIDENNNLVLTTAGSTRSLTAAQLDDCMFDVERFFILTVDGKAIIVPRRAFASDDEWADFLRSVRTRDDEEPAAEARAAKG